MKGWNGDQSHPHVEPLREVTMSRTLIIAGCLLLALGVLLHFVPGALSWFGRLPGDIRIEGERSKVFIPITSMLIVSILLSLLLALFRR